MLLNNTQSSEVMKAMASPAKLSFDFPVNGSIAEKIVVHERDSEVLVWMQCHGLTHSDERYRNRSEFVRAYALSAHEQKGGAA